MKPGVKRCPTPRLTAVPNGPRLGRELAWASVMAPRWIFARRHNQGAARWALRLTDLSTTFALLVLLLLTLVVAPATAADETVRLDCTPRTFLVVPGEPMRLELTVQADSAAPIRLHLPDDPRLKVRAIEKLPVQRTREGVIVQRRVVVWQGLEPGTVKLNNLSVETRGQKLRFPEVTITVRDPGP